MDTERYNRFSTLWPHSDFTVVYPERLPFLKEAILNYNGIPEDRREELKQAAKSSSRWAFVQVRLRAFLASFQGHKAAVTGHACLNCIVRRASPLRYTGTQTKSRV